jgi:hypothetical protein
MAAWSHLVVTAAFGPGSVGELSLATYVLPSIESGALVLMDRGYYAYGWLAALAERGVHFVVRARVGGRSLRPRRRRRIGEGDWVADLVMPRTAKKEEKALPESLRVRVVTYQAKGFRPVTLVTSLLDEAAYSADDLRLLYHGRWEKIGYDEIKTHLVGEKVAFRSKRPGRVLQEAYGLLIAYNVVRALMARAAAGAGVEPRRLSFVDSLERLRHTLVRMGLSKPIRLPALYKELLSELAATVLPARRPERRYPRAVKVKMSNFPLKGNQTGGQYRAPRRRAG